MRLRQYLVLVVMAFTLLSPKPEAACQDFSTYNDGPYVFYRGDTIDLKWIAKGELIEQSYLSDYDETIEIEVLDDMVMPLSSLRSETREKDSEFEFKGVDKIAAISDIHGQYDLMIDILQANKIIDKKNKWSFGEGHLVVTGDMLDRGDKCIDILWFLVLLEKQAVEAGGMVHVLKGNHELMVLKSDVRYIHKKYRYTSAKLRKPYAEFFGADTFLGRWIRSKPVYISINDIAFVHGGINSQFFDFNISLSELNNLFKTELVDLQVANIEADSILSWLYYENGPLWYREYASHDGFKYRDAKKVLKKLNKKRIVVGHTSLPEIRSIYENKIIFIDSSIKLGKTGEILIYDKKRFYRANEKGKRTRLEPSY